MSRVSVPVRVERARAEVERQGAVRSPTHLLLHDRTGRRWNLSTFEQMLAGMRAASVRAGGGWTLRTSRDQTSKEQTEFDAV